MKKILFTIALPQELKIIKEEVKSLKTNFKIDFLLTWVGNYNVIYNLKDYIEKKWKPDFIINIWVCGIKNNIFKDFFQVYKIKNFLNCKESICPIFFKFLDLKWIYSSEKVITNKNDLLEENFVDMESFWIDFICSKENIPYLIFKKPFDIIWEKSNNVSIKDLENSLKNFSYKELFKNIELFLNDNKNENFEEEILILKEKFKLTFSQTEILRKYINKEIAFWDEFKEVYENILCLDKNTLINKINLQK